MMQDGAAPPTGDRAVQDRSGRPRPWGQGEAWYPEPSEAKVVMALGVIAICVFPLVAPFAWAMGTREIRAIDAERRPPENRQLAQIGRVLGIVMSMVLIMFAVVVFGLIGYSLIA